MSGQPDQWRHDLVGPNPRGKKIERQLRCAWLPSRCIEKELFQTLALMDPGAWSKGSHRPGPHHWSGCCPLCDHGQRHYEATPRRRTRFDSFGPAENRFADCSKNVTALRVRISNRLWWCALWLHSKGVDRHDKRARGPVRHNNAIRAWLRLPP